MQKAFKWLDQQHIAYSFHDYKKSGIDEATIRTWLTQFPLDQIINTKGTTWKKLTDTEKESIQDVSKALPLILANPSMIKRPLVHSGKRFLLGYKEAEWEKALL